MTCEQYDAKDHTPVVDCSKPDIGICRDCTWPPPKPGDMGNCWARKNFTRYYANEYGSISGILDMKKEIYARGPIGASYFCWLKQYVNCVLCTVTIIYFRLWNGRDIEIRAL